MNNKHFSLRQNTLSDLLLRGGSLLYLGLLIALPILGIIIEACRGGLTNLWVEITTPQALYALKITFWAALIIVIINIFTGTITAWVLVRYSFPLKNTIDALIDLPFAIPTVVTGIMLVILYGPKSFIGGLLGQHGLEIVFNKPGIILALLFVTFPFVVRSVQPVLLEMDRDMEEAARTLGASPLTIFGRIILPSLAPSILTGAALSLSRALGEFGSIAIVAGNIPLVTQVASVYIYGEIESSNTQAALGLSLVLLIISFLILVFLNFLQNRSPQHEQTH